MWKHSVFRRSGSFDGKRDSGLSFREGALSCAWRGYFKNKKEIENYISDYITNSEFELELNSPELKNKIKKSIEKINFTNEDYYICIGSGIGCNDSIITNWYDSLKKEYSKALKEDLWVLKVCNYDPYNLALTGKTLTYVLSDILNLKESYFDKCWDRKSVV